MAIDRFTETILCVPNLAWFFRRRREANVDRASINLKDRFFRPGMGGGILGAEVIAPSACDFPVRGNSRVPKPARAVDNCQQPRVYFHG